VDGATTRTSGGKPVPLCSCPTQAKTGLEWATPCGSRSDEGFLLPARGRSYFVGVHRPLLAIVLLAWFCGLLTAQVVPSSFPAGKVTPKVVCSAHSKQSYALYLPSAFSATRKWPIIYLFDPLARGDLAVEAVRAAAEKFGYIVVASNNSRNGPMADSTAAANAAWQDSQERFPVEEQRRYLAGMSGGARLVTAIALSCDGCAAGVIANAAGFPIGKPPQRNMKFAYFGAVGNADFNYGEFVDLRKKLEDAGAQYRIRIFEGQHGWAPPEVWTEALNWMDIRAMTAGSLPRDPARIQQTADEALAQARDLQAKNNLLAAVRQYQSLVRDFKGLTDVAAAESSLAELAKNKAVKAEEKQEASALEQQARISDPFAEQMQALASGDSDNVDLNALKHDFADLRKRADSAPDSMPKSDDLKALVVRRALGGLVIAAYEAGQHSMEGKDYRAALAYFDLAAAGSASPAFAHYQRARAYAMLGDRKGTLAELRLALAAGFHDESALSAGEFQSFQGLEEFQALAAEWRAASEKERVNP
jgi:predicted esterase